MNFGPDNMTRRLARIRKAHTMILRQSLILRAQMMRVNASMRIMRMKSRRMTFISEGFLKLEEDGDDCEVDEHRSQASLNPAEIVTATEAAIMPTAIQDMYTFAYAGHSCKVVICQSF